MRASATGEWPTTSALVLEAIEALLEESGIAPNGAPPDGVDTEQSRFDVFVRNYIRTHLAAGRNVKVLRANEVLAAMGIPVEPRKNGGTLMRIARALKLLGYYRRHTAGGSVWVSDWTSTRGSPGPRDLGVQAEHPAVALGSAAETPPTP
jgi:hypothetical protein